MFNVQQRLLFLAPSQETHPAYQLSLTHGAVNDGDFFESFLVLSKVLLLFVTLLSFCTSNVYCVALPESFIDVLLVATFVLCCFYTIEYKSDKKAEIRKTSSIFVKGLVIDPMQCVPSIVQTSNVVVLDGNAKQTS